MKQKARGVIVGMSGFFAGIFTGNVLLQDWSLFPKVIVTMIVAVSVSVIVLKFTGRSYKTTGGTP